MVSLHLPSLYHDQETFGDPENFRPERFFDSELQKKISVVFQPFGHGSRRCIGEPLAVRQILCVLAVLAHQFEFSVQPDFVLKEKHGLATIIDSLPVIIKERK